MTETSDILPLVAAIEAAESAADLVAAVEALAATQSTAAVSTLIKVLGYNNPGAARAAVTGLVSLGRSAVMPLLSQLDEYNYGARAYAIRALAAIGDPQCLDVLLAASISDFAPSVRRAATKGLGALHWGLLSADQILPAQERVVTALNQLTQEADWALRYAVVVAYECLLPQLQSSQHIADVQTRLTSLITHDPDVTVRTRIQMIALPQFETSLLPAISEPTALSL